MNNLNNDYVGFKKDFWNNSFDDNDDNFHNEYE